MLPPGAEVAFPASVFLTTTHVVWVLAGRLTLGEGEIVHELKAGDRLVFGEASDIVYRNAGAKPCRYLVTVARNPG